MLLSADDESGVVQVRQDDVALDAVDGEYVVPSLSDSLSIHYEDGGPETLRLFDGKPIVFKSRHDWEGDARRVSRVAAGHYILIVPKDWQRKGQPPVAPEPCMDTDFMAHFFHRSEAEPAHDKDWFEGHTVALGRSGFELTGIRTFDDSEEGDLFVGDVPALNRVSDVSWARIGEEKKGGWNGENFKPSERSLAEVVNGRQGRFYIRVYDGAGLRDSGEFRYVRDLEIHVNGDPYTRNTLLVPAATGHPPTNVQFIGADDAILTREQPHAKVLPGSAISVAPHPDGDYLAAILRCTAASVRTVIRLPRIWWRMDPDDSSDGWRDTALELERRRFRDHAVAGIALWLRLPSRIVSVDMGFDEDAARTYRTQRSEHDHHAICTIPLTDFVNHSQIDQRLQRDAALNVRCGEAVLPLILVPADPAPTIVSFISEPAVVVAGETAALHWATRHAESIDVMIPGIGCVESTGSMTVEPTATTTFTLRLTAAGMADVTDSVTVTVRSLPEGLAGAQVKGAAGAWRRGKGFSNGELRAADLAAADAARRSLPVDDRRRTTHRANVDILLRSRND